MQPARGEKVGESTTNRADHYTVTVFSVYGTVLCRIPVRIGISHTTDDVSPLKKLNKKIPVIPFYFIYFARQETNLREIVAPGNLTPKSVLKVNPQE